MYTFKLKLKLISKPLRCSNGIEMSESKKAINRSIRVLHYFLVVSETSPFVHVIFTISEEIVVTEPMHPFTIDTFQLFSKKQKYVMQTNAEQR